MQSSTTRYGRNLQYAIIGRLKREHDAYGLDPDQIKSIIAVELMPLIESSDIIHVAPNFIICIDCPQTQQNLLATKLLETNFFQMHMVPWSYEHEWAQLPWINVPATQGSTISINPLHILPILSKRHKHPGNHVLKDSFAALIPKKYDLRAPDLSYLLIAELREFYDKKFAAFLDSKKIANIIYGKLHCFISEADKHIKETVKYMDLIQPESNSSAVHIKSTFINGLTTALEHTDVPLSEVDKLIMSTLSCNDEALNLEAFIEGPPTNEIAVPLTYADRLKTIYSASIQQIHRTTPIIETIKRAENRYETYITVAGFTRRYFGSHTKTAAAMEAQAVFYALKHLTNVQGYKIIDLNYPILEKLVGDIDRWNIQINKLQLHSVILLNQVQKIYNSIISVCHPAQLHFQTSYSFIHAANSLLDTLENIYISITDLCQALSGSKERYHALRIGIYSPTGSYYHWSQTRRPSSIS